MSKERELLRRLASGDNKGDFFISNELLKEIQQLLAQPEQIEQEPVAWMYERQNGDFTERTLSAGFEKTFAGVTTPLYTAPPKREPIEYEFDRVKSNREFYQAGYAEAERDLKREPLRDRKSTRLNSSH